MPPLTKIQLNDYEPGEFSELKQRSWPETLDLIEHFPWTQQRDHIAISPTNPSVTIEGPSDNYLKLATYYHDKFILYYLDEKNHLYTRSTVTIAEAYPFLQSFFDNNLDLSTFKLQPTPFVNNKIHFETKDFNYTMRPAPTLLGISFSAIFFLAPLIMLSLAAIIHPVSRPTTAKVIIIVAVSLLLAIPAILLIASFINHYRASNGRVLTISRGNPLFRFGPVNAPVTYDKKDIREVVLYGGSKGLEGLKRTEIIFNDGSAIDISGLLLPPDRMALKLPQQNIRRDTMSLPFIPPSSSTLS